jgi:3-hydroxybutyryl-CoA dehydrogenase
MSQKVTVLGAGTMGAGIAQLAAQQGFDVLLYDITDEFVQRGLNNIKAILQDRVDRGRLTADEMQAVLERITPTTKREDAAHSYIVIEAAPEDLQIKKEIFAALSDIAPSAILATNTSSLSITAIASASRHPERVVGMHFFNPAPVMPLVEVIAGSRTAPEVVEAVCELAARLGKTYVQAADMPGFIVNRVARPFYGEALKMVGEGTASIVQVDQAMRAAAFPMGPFELMDLIGIDVNFAVTRSVYEAFFGEARYRPHPIQQRMVEAGTLGRKTGRGFYEYPNGQKGNPAWRMAASFGQKRLSHFVPPELVNRFLSGAAVSLPAESEQSEEQGQIIARILAMIINEAAFAAGEGVASVRDIDRAMKLGTNYPKGPLRWADEIGLDVVYSVLRALQDSLGEDRYRPAPLLYQLVRSGLTGDAVGEGFHSPGEKGMV